MPGQVRQEWILEAADERSAMRYAHPLGPVGLGVTIAPLARNDVAYAASRIRHVAGVPWDYVDMEMENRLSSRSAHVDADVETIGPVRLFDRPARDVNSRHERILLFRGGVEPGGDVPRRHEQRMSW